jgi:hypothetical protein
MGRSLAQTSQAKAGWDHFWLKASTIILNQQSYHLVL